MSLGCSGGLQLYPLSLWTHPRPPRVMMTVELQAALARRDAIIDKMLTLSEYAPMALKRVALNAFMLTGHQQVAQPIELRRAQEKVLELLGV